MQTRNRIVGALCRVAAAGTLLVMLAGCVDGRSLVPDLATPAPTVTTAVEVAEPDPRLDCAAVMPLDAVAGILGVAAADLVLTLDRRPPGSAEAVKMAALRVAMADAAQAASGEQSCRYAVAAAGDQAGPYATVSVLPDSASYFGLAEPDANDGLPMPPAELGDSAFSYCRSGEWDGCRAEVLVGTTWLSVTVATQDLEESTFLDYARTVVQAVAGLSLSRPDDAPRAECAALLSPHDLDGPGRLVVPDGGELAPVGGRSFSFIVPQYLAGLVDCSWVGTGEAGVIPAEHSAVGLMILPDAGQSWSKASPADLPSTIPLLPVDLSGQSGAHWPAAGVQALGGCAADQCEVTLLAGDVWLTVTTSGPADLAGAQALAAAAYTRYAAAV